jgi:hypothetical protein
LYNRSFAIDVITEVLEETLRDGCFLIVLKQLVEGFDGKFADGAVVGFGELH